MNRVDRAALALASTTLFGASAPLEFSSQTLSMLDPSAAFTALCGGGGSPSMRGKLAMSAAIVQAMAQSPAGIRLYDGLGKVHFPITTASPEAQRYFDQGMAFAYGFNHAAAIASFREAQRLDPSCAMCWWGESLAYGPNINAPLTPDANELALKAIARAQQLSTSVTPPERALIMALTKRYSADPNAKRTDLDGAYADAMLTIARYYPQHDDIALLAAESAMDTLPWDYWEPDKQSAKPRLGEAIRLVEMVMARNPDHPQGAHLYIHLMENGPDPKRAEAAADRLSRPLAGDAGHLVHMPAHIYYRLGRWKDSIRVNIDAAHQDEAYIKESGDKGFVRYGYYPHNVHFIVTSAQMGGDLPTAISEAKRLASIVDAGTAAQLAWVQAINAAPYFATLQFASPAEVLAMPEPDPRLVYVQGIRHYVRAVAYAEQNNRRGFDRELADLKRLQGSELLKPMVDQGMPAPDLLALAEHVALGKQASFRGRHLQAADHFRAALAIENGIPYMEPPWWYYPVNQSLGAALYRAGKYEEARQAFTAALAKYPGNGWALYGLAMAERAQGRPAQAAAARAALGRAWLGDYRWLKMERI
ncbi:tetratricopeptide repeat protein [Sphingomonas sp. G124]|uniref:Tetratricopeptide repeat protein n=1 Tax=Sphingomonas cremea TaxID=2904799 RepID=A0A9X1QNA9_9SPHN|nr:tetratricopeptide repeat protein [Sphingomonas cremea]MCF2514474.1 tetratricopeptide repeat protein [Sphingomonas cremea]